MAPAIILTLPAILFVRLALARNEIEIRPSQADPLEEWIDTLGAHENCPPQGIVDTNGKMSYGRWCYQFDTFKKFVRQFNLLPNTEDDELMNWIGDDSFQRRLTVLVFKDSLGNWKHWKNTVERKDVGMPPLAK